MALPQLSYDAIQAALDEFDAVGRAQFLEKYGFGVAQQYFVAERGGLYDSKAVVGAAAGYMPGGAPWTAGQFSGGSATVVRLLTGLGIRVMREARPRPVPVQGWDLHVGQRIRRVDLHRRFGGRGQSGIAPSSSTPNVLVFTAASSGHQHGYFDQWEGEYFYYTGEGQHGDQTFTSGNRAILQHLADGRALRLFNGARGVVTYAGQFALAEDQPWEFRQAPETGGGPLRRVIAFRLVKVMTDDAAVPEEPGALGRDFVERNEDVPPAAGEPAMPNPDAVGRGLRSHRMLEDLLGRELRARGLRALDPEVQDPPFDVAWVGPDGVVHVVEVKSTTRGNESRQLRLGVGQVLDYRHSLRLLGHEQVQAILFVEHEPAGSHWHGLCAEHGITLVWPGSVAALFDTPARG